MSFFGQNNNNQQQGTGFGGFGSTNNNTSGFGQPAAPATGFGAGTSNTTGGGFGGFGSGGNTGFGATTTNSGSLFGQSKPAFGASNTGGGLFGGGTTSTPATGGFGGFGSNNTSGNNATTGGLFGAAAKPAFGNTASTTTGGSIFGSANTGGFGSTTTPATGAFGAPAIGQANAVCEGTGSTPFTAFTEKDKEGAGSATNHYQSISFMAPYKNFTFEELRIADYNQGRKYGNGSGQAGAFGSTNFGGFGQQNTTTGGFGQPAAATGGGLFGAAATPAAPFGSTASTGFGANTGGSLFGQKPAGLFGSTTPAQPSGGLLGNTNASNTGFGSNNTSGGFGAGGGGLFGASSTANQQQQPKPFSFGATSGATGGAFGAASGGFGSTNNNTATANNATGTGLFGQANQNSSTPFGQQNTTQAGNPFGGFGQQNQNQTQTTTSNPFGGFGQQNQEQKPGGLFGNTTNNSTTTGGLFGAQNNSNTATGGLFGQANNINQAAANSPFGQKPTTGGLFGAANNTTSNTAANPFAGFGAASNQSQTQPNQTGGLFGNTANNSQAKPGGLFGNTTTGTTGGLFGNNANNNNGTQQQSSGGNLFNLGGNNNQQQPAGSSLFGNTNGLNNNNTNGSSLFGNTQQNQQQNTSAPQNAFQPAQSLQASLLDPNAFGSPSIFSGLPPPPQVSGPIATPISQKSRPKKNALLPYYKITPTASASFHTPQKRGYGFTYSTYGTPNSASSNASTPNGFGSSLFSSSYGRGLGKSLSTSNLRTNFSDSESLLTPGAFSAGSSRYGGPGSMKKLTIDRSLRTDLFGDRGSSPALSSPEKDKSQSSLKKKVSFDSSTMGGSEDKPSDNSADVNGASGTPSAPSAQEQGYLRSPKPRTPMKPSGLSSQMDMEPVRGNELAIVHEDETAMPASAPPKKALAPMSQEDQKAGDYWMKPSKAEIQKLSKEQQKHLESFTVGRVGCGKVEFNGAVDVSNINLDDILGTIVVVDTRSLTVYPEKAKKPTMGKGMNVPSTIYLENSWPRARDKKTPSYERSGARFAKHVDRLRKVTGTEFVTYEKDTGIWVFKVPHFTTYGFNYDDGSDGESLHMSLMSEAPDTPTPKPKTKPKQMEAVSAARSQSKVSQEAVAKPPASKDTRDRDTVKNGHNKSLIPGAFDEDDTMLDDAGQASGVGLPMDQSSFLDERLVSPSEDDDDEPSEVPEVKTTDQSLVVRDDETDDDMALEMIGAYPDQEDDHTAVLELESSKIIPLDVSGDWALDLQNSFRPTQKDRQALRDKQDVLLSRQQAQVMQITALPASNLARSITTHTDLMNSLFEQSPLQNLGRDPKLKTITSQSHAPLSSDAETESGDYWESLIKKTKHDFPTVFEREVAIDTSTLLKQRESTTFVIKQGLPHVVTEETSFQGLARAADPQLNDEQDVWDLSSILFDQQDPNDLDVPSEELPKYESRIRKDRLCKFWSSICLRDTTKNLDGLSDLEEQAIQHLAAFQITQACEALGHGKNYRLATLVSQIGGSTTVQEGIVAQIDEWRSLNALSEFNEPIRAIYSLLAGQTCICKGTEKVHREDLAESFSISKRFNLSWKQALGLRLFYATSLGSPLEDSVALYAQDLVDTEPCKPGTDISWILYQIYAASKRQAWISEVDDAFLAFANAAGRDHARLAFQLYHILHAKFSDKEVSSAANSLTTLLAVQLEARFEWLSALFVVLHLSDQTARRSSAVALLRRHAKDIDTESTTNATWKSLVEEFKIPDTWIWQAKASDAYHNDGNRPLQVRYLLKAQDWKEAHAVLKLAVGPALVIAEDWTGLRNILQAFGPNKEKIATWGLGGKVYEDYVEIVKGRPEGKRKSAILARLSETIPAVVQEAESSKDKKSQRDDHVEESKERFAQLAALQEMTRVVKAEVLAMREQGIEAVKKITFPEREDPELRKTMQMSSRYHRAIAPSQA